MTVAPFSAPPALEDFAALAEAIAVEIVRPAALWTRGSFRAAVGVEREHRADRRQSLVRQVRAHRSERYRAYHEVLTHPARLA